MTATRQRHWMGVLSVVAGGLALLAALLPAWVLPVVMPPQPVEQVVADTAQRLKDRVVAKVRGLDYEAPAPRTDWYRVFAAVAITLGTLALVLAALSLAVQQPWRYAAAAAALGLGAIVFQYSLMLAGAIVFLLVVLVVLSLLNASV